MKYKQILHQMLRDSAKVYASERYQKAQRIHPIIYQYGVSFTY